MINTNSLIPYSALKNKGEANFPDTQDISETSESIKKVFSNDNVVLVL